MKKKVQVVVTGDSLNWGKEPKSVTDLISLVESFDPDKHELVKIGSHDISIDNKVMTKEEILDDIFDSTFIHVPVDYKEKMSYLHQSIMQAMQQYADQQSVEVHKTIDVVSYQHPYKKVGDRDSYSDYNQGWSDACNVIKAKLEEKFKQSQQPLKP